MSELQAHLKGGAFSKNISALKTLSSKTAQSAKSARSSDTLKKLDKLLTDDGAVSEAVELLSEELKNLRGLNVGQAKNVAAIVQEHVRTTMTLQKTLERLNASQQKLSAAFKKGMLTKAHQEYAKTGKKVETLTATGKKASPQKVVKFDDRKILDLLSEHTKMLEELRTRRQSSAVAAMSRLGNSISIKLKSLGNRLGEIRDSVKKSSTDMWKRMTSIRSPFTVLRQAFDKRMGSIRDRISGIGARLKKFNPLGGMLRAVKNMLWTSSNRQLMLEIHGDVKKLLAVTESAAAAKDSSADSEKPAETKDEKEKKDAKKDKKDEKKKTQAAEKQRNKLVARLTEKLNTLVKNAQRSASDSKLARSLSTALRRSGLLSALKKGASASSGILSGLGNIGQGMLSGLRELLPRLLPLFTAAIPVLGSAVMLAIAGGLGALVGSAIYKVLPDDVKTKIGSGVNKVVEGGKRAPDIITGLAQGVMSGNYDAYNDATLGFDGNTLERSEKRKMYAEYVKKRVQQLKKERLSITDEDATKQAVGEFKDEMDAATGLNADYDWSSSKVRELTGKSGIDIQNIKIKPAKIPTKQFMAGNVRFLSKNPDFDLSAIPDPVVSKVRSAASSAQMKELSMWGLADGGDNYKIDMAKADATKLTESPYGRALGLYQDGNGLVIPKNGKKAATHGGAVGVVANPMDTPVPPDTPVLQPAKDTASTGTAPEAPVAASSSPPGSAQSAQATVVGPQPMEAVKPSQSVDQYERMPAPSIGQPESREEAPAQRVRVPSNISVPSMGPVGLDSIPMHIPHMGLLLVNSGTVS